MPKYMNTALNSDPVRKRTKGMVHGVGRPRLNLGEIRSIVLPLPPLAEQTRIVAEVERRLSVVDELEAMVTANLQRAVRFRQSILQKAFTGELVGQETEELPANVVRLPKAAEVHAPNSHFARVLLSGEIVHRLHDEPTFGRIKHQKIFHLCEHIAQIEEIHGQYHREAAGPLDNKLIYANEAELKKQKWYQEVRRESYGHAYQALAKAGGHRKYVERYWAEKLPTIEKLIELMRKWDTDRCEIFCTAYAAWNDLVLWGKPATEENILHEILECWHDSKKRFPKDRWLKAIAWMKINGFVPTGFGKPTKILK
jgi:type I restriction enzyme S subunit